MRRRKPIPINALEDGPWLVHVGTAAPGTATSLVGRLGDGWAYVMHLAFAGGRWIVAGLEVFPEPPDLTKRVGDRQADLSVRTAPAPPPGAGLAARHLRRIPFGGRSGFALMNQLADGAARIARAYQPTTKRGDGRVVEIARLYAEAYRRGSRSPLPEIAKALGVSISAVRDAVSRARKKGFLSLARKQGVGGGELTPSAVALLANTGKSEATRSGRQRLRAGVLENADDRLRNQQVLGSASSAGSRIKSSSYRDSAR